MLKKDKLWLNKENILMIKVKNEEPRYYTPKHHKYALIKYFHEHPMKMHQGIQGVTRDIKENFYWPKMDDDIIQYVRYCNVCMKAKHGPKKYYGLQKLWTSKYFNHVIAIDHKGPLPRTKSGNKYITTIIDRFSGYACCMAIPRINSYTTAWNLINHWIAKFGVPFGILSDQGSDFMSGILNAIYKMFGMEHKISSAYNPQTNGKVERFNRVLSESLKVIANERQLKFNEENATWDLYLPFIAAAHNNKKSRTTNLSPNEIVYGRRIKLPHHIEINDIEQDMNAKFNGYIKNIVRINEKFAQDHLEKYDETRKQQYDKNRKDITYKIGDLVQMLQGPIKVQGNEKYNPSRWTTIFKIVVVRPSKLNYDIQDIKDQKYIIRNVNIKKLIPYVEQIVESESENENEEEKQSYEEYNSDLDIGTDFNQTIS
jgi:hypothetical protein